MYLRAFAFAFEVAFEFEFVFVRVRVRGGGSVVAVEVVGGSVDGGSSRRVRSTRERQVEGKKEELSVEYD